MESRPFHRYDSSGRDVPVVNRDEFYIKDQYKHFGEHNALELIEHTIAVDSANRDGTIYPNPNHFKVYLRTPIANIVSCELLSVEFPNVQNLVGATNHTFSWTEVVDGTAHSLSFSIPTGHYDGIGLAQEIARLMNVGTTVRGFTSVYSVDFVPERSRFVFKTLIQSVDKFRLDLDDCATFLGFVAGPTAWNTESVNVGVDPSDPLYLGALVSPNYANLFGDSYAFLSCPELNTSFHETTYNRSLTNAIAPAVSNAFARLATFGESGGVTFYSTNTATMVRKVFKPPLAKLDQMEFMWLRKDGTPVDFQNIDNSFILRFHCRGRSLGMPQLTSRT